MHVLTKSLPFVTLYFTLFSFLLLGYHTTKSVVKRQHMSPNDRKVKKTLRETPTKMKLSFDGVAMLPKTLKQEYNHSPILVSEHDNRKIHEALRTKVPKNIASAVLSVPVICNSKERVVKLCRCIC